MCKIRYMLSGLLIFFVMQLASCATADGLPEHALPKENSGLYLGNPSHAKHDPEDEDNYLMEKTGYALSYNNHAHEPNWVAWHLCRDDIGSVKRSNKFRADDDLPAAWYHAVPSDYQFVIYGFDRGHMCPSADRTSDTELNSETFLMTNMVPQSPDNNRKVWKGLEDYERGLTADGDELYIIAGPAGRGGRSGEGTFEAVKIPARTPDGKPVIDANGMLAYSDMTVNVPAYTWKIIIALPEGTDDISRITPDTAVLAVCIPNDQQDGIVKSWEDFRVSVDYLEGLTGYDFFDRLPDEIEAVLEARLPQQDGCGR